MSKTTFTFAVTFEFEVRPPVTYRGTVEAGGVHVGASRAIRIAQKVLRPVNWTSMNCVVLERAPERVVAGEPVATAGVPSPGGGEASPEISAS